MKKLIYIFISFIFIESVYAESLHDRFHSGISTHIGLSKDTESEVRMALSITKSNSFRDEIYWTTVADRNGTIGLNSQFRKQLDQYRQIAKGNVCMLLILSYGHPAHTTGLPDNEYEIGKFQEYVDAVLKEIDFNLCGIEIWNEWNIGLGSINPKLKTGSPESYVQLVKSTISTIRLHKPSTPIIVGALANKNTEWLLYVAERLVDFDIQGYSVHPYNFGETDPTADNVYKWLQLLITRLQAATKKTPAIYVTEIGWPNFSGKGGVSEDVAATRIIELNTLLRTIPNVKGIWWYGLKDKGRDMSNKEHGFGLLRQDGASKPALLALKNFNSYIEGCTVNHRRSRFNLLHLSCTPSDKLIVTTLASDQYLNRINPDCEMTDIMKMEVTGNSNLVANMMPTRPVGLLASCLK